LADKYNSQDGVQWFADDVRMKWTLTQQPTTNVSVMAMTVYPTFGQSLLVDGILLVLFIPMYINTSYYIQASDVHFVTRFQLLN